MSLDTFFRIADRFGVPVALLAFLCFAAVLLIRGPLMKFVEIVGAPLAQLVRSAINFVSAATAKLESIESAVKLEAERTRGTITAEGAATREHMGSLAEGLRDRMSDAERAVTSTGQHHAMPASTPERQTTLRSSADESLTAR